MNILCLYRKGFLAAMVAALRASPSPMKWSMLQSEAMLFASAMLLLLLLVRVAMLQSRLITAAGNSHIPTELTDFQQNPHNSLICVAVTATVSR